MLSVPEAAAESDLRAFAEQLSAELRTLKATGDAREWKQRIERRLVEAYRQHEARGLSAIVTLVISLLDATGRHDLILDELAYAINIAGRDPDALALLEAKAAANLVSANRLDEAIEAIQRSEAAAARASAPDIADMALSIATTARMRMLQPVDMPLVDRLVHVVPPADALLLQSYESPYLYAVGQRAEAPLRLRAFRSAAESFDHAWRLEDVKSFAAAEGAIARPLKLPSAEDIPAVQWFARWRVGLVRFRAAHLAGNASQGLTEVRELDRLQQSVVGVDLDRLGCLAAFHEARAGGGETPVRCMPPNGVTLAKLPAALAGAEAVALAGSQALAHRWLRWIQDELPPLVRTSLEWPVSRARVTALLALRAGSIRVADAAFAEAVEWSRAADYPCELALAKVQWAEFRRHHSPTPGTLTDDFRTMRGEGWEWLTAAGIDPARFSYDVARLCAAPGNESLAPQLTRREIEVLGLLAEGLTYPVIGERLGLARGSVQVHAHKCYEKLGVSGREPAVRLARELGIL